ncbi:two-component response regulator (CheY-like receiver domain and a winged-helix DNA-binding domain) [Desulforapulum autotrophicum HRM2]|uniref:Two-component response regulator (CheY-like receiver domain and a winged-helix DNA-binding domain) n=1 Tax=Desulforapulum autotrophicum (strain ATCC 43914 / DSM 3382 / VKM B-1955 / HRM2) TaxID=177437 RepID=C0QAU6_DESAH|nr:response regulator [Desulforapulum autotrophicum]ACN16879.1 two-component response regulator (CheY-like receiver domain and a winged-helix DNA-binding domain) [Desulforapulum autotrophicum HRM2]
MEIKVLVVDDEIDFLETIIKRLNKKGINTVGVSSGEAAVEKIKESAFDVILLDIKMAGGMDGIDTLQEIKRLRPLAQVILLTGHGTVESSVEGMKLGAFDYVLKPARFEDLCEKITKAYQEKENQDSKIRKANIDQLVRFPGRVFDQ